MGQETKRGERERQRERGRENIKQTEWERGKRKE